MRQRRQVSCAVDAAGGGVTPTRRRAEAISDDRSASRRIMIPARHQLAIERVEPAFLGGESADLGAGSAAPASSTAGRAAPAPGTISWSPAHERSRREPADGVEQSSGMRLEPSRSSRRGPPAAPRARAAVSVATSRAADEHREAIGQPLDVAHLVRAEEHGLSARRRASIRP